MATTHNDNSDSLDVLVVDDSTTMVRIIKNTLLKIDDNLKIHVAYNGKEALNIFHNNNIDLILTDWNMPEMNGIELIKAIRKASEIPIIMITTEGGKSQVITALKAGANQCIIKPFNQNTLKEKLQYLFE